MYHNYVSVENSSTSEISIIAPNGTIKLLHNDIIKQNIKHMEAVFLSLHVD